MNSAAECPLCRRRETRLRYRLEGKAIFWCRSCETLFVDPFPKKAALQASYEDTSAEFQKSYFESFQDLRSKSFARGLATLKRLGRKGILLDVGTGLGFFLDQAREAGWEAEGLEVSGKTAQYAQKTFQCPVHLGMLETAPLETGRYQVITLWDVLEHLPDPEEALSRIRTLLSQGGVVVIRTPVCDSLIPWLLHLFYRWSAGRLRFGLEKLFKEHLFHFTEKGLCRLVTQSGFRLLHRYREDYIDLHTLPRKGWAKNPLIRLGALCAILISHGIRRQDEVILYAESSS